MPWTEIQTRTSEYFTHAAQILNSQFFSAFFSALAGAGLGAYGAQQYAERSRTRTELIEALRQSNALLVLSWTIANQALAAKLQHVDALAKSFRLDRESAEKTIALVQRGEEPERPLVFTANLAKIAPLTVPVDALKNMIYGSKLMPGRALALASMVEQAITNYAQAIDVRNDQIERFRVKEGSSKLSPEIYFGLRGEDGSIDSLFHDSILAMSEYIDDVAFFSSELADEIQQHGEKVREKLLRATGDAPKASKVDFSAARDSGLLPNRERYKDWLSGFANTN